MVGPFVSFHGPEIDNILLFQGPEKVSFGRFHGPEIRIAFLEFSGALSCHILTT